MEFGLIRWPQFGGNEVQCRVGQKCHGVTSAVHIALLSRSTTVKKLPVFNKYK